MYYWSIGAVFKNESWNLKEWIDHYISRGVDHIYLINDGSTDEFRNILDEYKNIVTLFENSVSNEIRGERQIEIYETYLKPIVYDSVWFSILDLDEFLYCPNFINVKDALKNNMDTHEILINWVSFGSNNLITHPKSIVEGFTKRANDSRDYVKSFKSIFQTQYLENFGIHYMSMKTHNTKNISDVFKINHYLVQSLDFWKHVKMTRGDVNRWHKNDARDLEYFWRCDFNDEDDFELVKQNTTIKSLQQNLNSSF